MRYELPAPVKQSLATRSMRLHHFLWHAIRNNWHAFTEAERTQLRQNHPGWVPNIPRFTGTAQNPQINYQAGESFLYMHRQMLGSINVQLAALGQPAVVPWPAFPEVNDPDYPVPGRKPHGAADDPKSDAMLQTLKQRAAHVLRPDVLRAQPLAAVGASVESAIHDFLHMRWADVSPGKMASFPQLDPSNVNPTIPTELDAPDVDWLGHPYSSHVNSVFWKLHGWVDQVVEAWRTARNLPEITWTDTWVGDHPHDMQPHALMALAPAERLARMHDHFTHGHHSNAELLQVLKTINGFKECHIGFDYVLLHHIPLEPLSAG